ncbi:hypothetical protein LINGRAHAP2_LOCUS11203 [Linum grandiflorum]
MTQERLNRLAMLAIEEKFLEDAMEELIENFISKNTIRLLRLKQSRMILLFLQSFLNIYNFFNILWEKEI